MITLEVNTKEFAQQVTKAKAFAATSSSDNLHEKRNIELHMHGKRLTLVATSRCFIERRHTVGVYKIHAITRLDGDGDVAINVDVKELADAVKAQPKVDAVTLHMTSKTLVVGGMPVTVRMFPNRASRNVIAAAEDDTEYFAELDKQTVSKVKRLVVPFAAQPRDNRTLSNLRFRDGTVEATDSYGAIRLPVLPFNGDTAVSVLAFKHVALSDSATLYSAEEYSILETSKLKIYSTFHHVEDQPNLDMFFKRWSEKTDKTLVVNVKPMLEALKPIKKLYGKDGEIYFVKRGSNLHFVHVDPVRRTAGTIHATLTDVGGAGDSVTLWDVDRLLRYFGRQAGDMRMVLPEKPGTPAEIEVDGCKMVLMRKRASDTGITLAMEATNNDQ